MLSQKSVRSLALVARYAACLSVCLTMMPIQAMADRAFVQDRGPAPYHVDGHTKSSAKTFGFHEKIWRRWPGAEKGYGEGQGKPLPPGVKKVDVPSPEDEDKAKPAPRPAPRAAGPSDSEDKAPIPPFQFNDNAPAPPAGPAAGPSPRLPGPRMHAPGTAPGRPPGQPGQIPPSGRPAIPPAAAPGSGIPKNFDDLFPTDPSPGSSTYRATPRSMQVQRVAFRKTDRNIRVSTQEIQVKPTAQSSARIKFRIIQPQRSLVRDEILREGVLSQKSKSSLTIAEPRLVSPPKDPAPALIKPTESINPLRPGVPQRVENSTSIQPVRASVIRPVAHSQPVDLIPVLASRSTSNPLRSR